MLAAGLGVPGGMGRDGAGKSRQSRRVLPAHGWLPATSLAGAPKGTGQGKREEGSSERRVERPAKRWCRKEGCSPWTVARSVLGVG